MEPLVITLAFLLGLALRRIGYPPILGYLLAGFIAHAAGIGSGAALAPLAEAGILLLFFTIGLKLNLRDLAPRYVWGSALVHMLLVIPLTAGVLLMMAALYPPLSFAEPGSALTLAFALSFSSTVLAIKLFEDRGEIASFHASITIGILIVQDVMAVVYLVVSSAHWPSPWALALLGLPLLLPLFRRVLNATGHGELLLLAGVTFAFGAAELFEWLDLKGGLGALLMGMLLSKAHEPKARELHIQLLGLKNLLLIGFFLQIGYYGLPRMELIGFAFVLGLLATLRPLVYFVLLTVFGLRARTGWFAGLALFNYSEFGLIVAAMAQQTGVLGEQWMTTLALAMALSFAFAIPVNRNAHKLYIRHADRLRRFQKKERLPEERIGSLNGANIAILGMGRVGRGAFEGLREAGYDNIIGIEENYARTLLRIRQGWPCVHGDASDRDFWERTGLVNCRLILVSLSNHREHLRIARLARELGFANTMAVATRFSDEVAELEKLGCLTFYRYERVGQDFAEFTLSRVSLDR